MEKPRRKMSRPWVFLFVDAWTSARMRLFGGQEHLRMATEQTARIYAEHNPPGVPPLIGGVAVLERSLNDEEPRVLAVYYGPGDERNTVLEADVPEARAVVRGPWGGASEPLPMAARERGGDA